MESQSAGVGGQQVVGAADGVRGLGAQTLREQFHAGPNGAAGRGGRLGRPARGAGGQAAQVLVLVVLQEEGAGEGIDHGRAGPGLLAALQADVVVDADPGQGGQFLTAQPGRTAQAGTGRQAGLLWAHPGPR